MSTKNTLEQKRANQKQTYFFLTLLSSIISVRQEDAKTVISASFPGIEMKNLQRDIKHRTISKIFAGSISRNYWVWCLEPNFMGA